MAKKKAKKKVSKPAAEEVVVEEKAGEEVVSEAAHVPEQIVTRRGTGVGGTRVLTKSEYDKEMKKERGKSK